MRVGTAARVAMISALALALGACTVPEVDLVGKACDNDHPCAAGYLCAEGVCVVVGPEPGLDGGMPEDGGDAGDGGPTGACTPPDSRPCGSNVGECRQGTQSCGEDGLWGPCEGAVGPVDEICDGKDNDCDGETDEGLDDDGDGHGKPGAGCPLSDDDCDDFAPKVHPGAEEICDGKDNNCDGEVDEGFDCRAGHKLDKVCVHVGEECTTEGWMACAVDCKPDSRCFAPRELCNGRDDDCDGEIDNGLNLSGPVPIGVDGKAGAASPSVAPSSEGGFNAGFVATDGASTFAALQAVNSHVEPQSIVRVTGGTNEIGSPAVSRRHFAWIETSAEGSRVRAVELTSRGSPSAPFDVSDSYPSLSNLVAADLGTGTVLAAVSEAGASLLVVKLGGNARQALTLLPLPEGVKVSRPSFGTTGGDRRVLYYEREEAGARTLGLRRIDSSGIPEASDSSLSAGSGIRFVEPAGAPGAVALVEDDGTLKSREVVLARSVVGTSLGAKVILSEKGKTASSPTVAWLPDGDRDVYLVAWLETAGGSSAIQAARVEWMDDAWGPVSTRTGFFSQGRSVVSPAAGSDGEQFVVLFGAENALDSLTTLRKICPAN